MRRIFIFLPMLALLNLTYQSSASQAAAQPKNILRFSEGIPTYAGEKVVYVETRESYPEATFRDPELYAPEFMKIFLKDSQLKGQCRTLFIGFEWQGLKSKGLDETIHYFETVLKNGGVIFMVNLNPYLEEIYKPVHHMYNQLLTRFSGQIQFLEQADTVAGETVFSWWNNNPWKTSKLLLSRKSVLATIINALTDSPQTIPALIKKTFAIEYEQHFPAKLHTTISFDQFMHPQDPFELVSLTKQGVFPLLTFDLIQVDSHFSVKPHAFTPFNMLNPEQLEVLRKEILAFEKTNQEKIKKEQLTESTLQSKPEIHLSTFTEAFTYQGEKIVYLGIGTHRDAQDQFPAAESYPEFVKGMCQRPRYNQNCKLILIDGLWKKISKKDFSTIFTQPLPQTSFFIGDYIEPQNLKQIQAYLETVLSPENGGAVCFADFTCPLAPEHPDDDMDVFQISLRNMYNQLLKKFPHQIEFFEYRMISPATEGLTVTWWQRNSWDDRASNILMNRLSTLESLFQRVSRRHKKLTLKALKKEFVSHYNNKFPARLHASTTLEQFMHEKLPCELVSLAKTDLLPVLTFSIQKEGSRYTLEPELSRKPLDIFDLKQLDALSKEFLTREKALAERYAQCVNPQVSVQAPITQEVSQTSSQSEKVSQEEGKKKSNESCVVA